MASHVQNGIPSLNLLGWHIIMAGLNGQLWQGQHQHPQEQVQGERAHLGHLLLQGAAQEEVTPLKDLIMKRVSKTLIISVCFINLPWFQIFKHIFTVFY